MNKLYTDLFDDALYSSLKEEKAIHNNNQSLMEMETKSSK